MSVKGGMTDPSDGQVTRVHPVQSEVTLLTDRHQAIPVINTRTGAVDTTLMLGKGPTGAGAAWGR